MQHTPFYFVTNLLILFFFLGYLHNHHHHHFSHFSDQQQQQVPQPQLGQPASTHPSPGHLLQQSQPRPNSGHPSGGIIRPMTPQSGTSSSLGPLSQSQVGLQQMYHPESHHQVPPQQGPHLPPPPMSTHHHPHPHLQHHQQQMGNHLGNHQQGGMVGTPLMNSLNHHPSLVHASKFEYFTGNLPPPLHAMSQQQTQQQHSQSQTALNHLCTTPTSLTPPSSSSVAFASSTLGRKKVTLSAALDHGPFHHSQGQGHLFASTANFTPNHRIIIEDQL